MIAETFAALPERVLIEDSHGRLAQHVPEETMHMFDGRKKPEEQEWSYVRPAAWWDVYGNPIDPAQIAFPVRVVRSCPQD